MKTGRPKIHGLSRSRTYHCWNSMLQRCTNRRHKSYKHYGGKGVWVCARWLVFENFVHDMGECPPGHSIERRDNRLNYTFSNCRWATPKEQARNRTNNVFIRHKGKKVLACVVAELIGVSYNTLMKRLYAGKLQVVK